MKHPIEIGKTYAVKYPFVRATYNVTDESGSYSDECWRPGCGGRAEQPHGEYVFKFDGHGEMLLKVVSAHKPGKYTERVFYVRTWKDPDGKTFGRNNLRVTTAAAFMRLLHGYRHAYINESTDEVVPACEFKGGQV